jgi:signal transduction histidine kinase
MTVNDNGCGFDVDAVRSNGEGFGLVSMEERAHLFGGSVSVQSGPAGTTVTVHAPASAPSESAAAG